MKFRCVILDCDGVMFDSLCANEAYYNHIRGHFGLPPVTKADMDYVHMATSRESIDYLFPEPELRHRAQAYCMSVDYTPFTSSMVMEPSLIDLLNFLRPEVKTAVATNRAGGIHHLLERFQLAGLFDLVVSSLDVRRPKPDPEPTRLILDRFGLDPREALFVGDAETDQKSARGAGVAFAAYKNPELEADFHLDSLSQVKDLVRRS